MPLPFFHLAAWLQDRIDSRQLKAKLAALEEELEHMEAAPVHEEVNDGEYESHRCSAHSERGLIHGWSCALSRFPLSLKKAGSFLASFLRLGGACAASGGAGAVAPFIDVMSQLLIGE
jgi:hypothetical protein